MGYKPCCPDLHSPDLCHHNPYCLLMWALSLFQTDCLLLPWPQHQGSDTTVHIVHISLIPAASGKMTVSDTLRWKWVEVLHLLKAILPIVNNRKLERLIARITKDVRRPGESSAVYSRHAKSWISFFPFHWCKIWFCYNMLKRICLEMECKIELSCQERPKSSSRKQLFSFIWSCIS